MKIFILLLFVASVVACSEEETFCYECLVIEDGKSNETFQRCDITEVEAKEIENAGSEFYSPYKTPYIAAFTKRTTCLKKAG